MKYSHLLKLIEENELSPEQFAPCMGLSGMTLRRWKEQDPNTELPPMYARSLLEAAKKLHAEKKLSPKSHWIMEIIDQKNSADFEKTIQNLGFSEEFIHSSPANEEKLLEGMSQIGSREVHKANVEKNKKKIISFKKLGKDWKFRITTLLNIIKSKKLTSIDKLAAYGALFYLITVIDLIPDTIPFFGLMDDLTIMGLVTTYYLKRFKSY